MKLLHSGGRSAKFQVFSSEWTAVALGLAIFAVHGFWFLQADHQAEVLSGLGGALTVLGVYIAGQPYIRKGLYETAREQAGLHEAEDIRKKMSAQGSNGEMEGVRHVMKERVVGVALVSIGSALNGYGPAIATALSLRGSR